MVSQLMPRIPKTISTSRYGFPEAKETVGAEEGAFVGLLDGDLVGEFVPSVGWTEGRLVGPLVGTIDG